MNAPRPGLGAVIPAAGLGTRLRPLTDHTPKELLGLGPWPAIAGALLEAVDAGLAPVVVVLGPHKQALADWLSAQTLCPVATVLQPEPLGVLDAVARGAALLGTAQHVVLYPDYLHLPAQRGLARLLAHRPDPEATVFGLVEVTAQGAGRMGRSARVARAEVLDGPLRRIMALDAPPAPAPGALHTTFAELRGAEHARAVARAHAQGHVGDAANLPALTSLARDGRLFGVLLGGDILDLGVMPGYLDARDRFERGLASWRQLPTPEAP